jgi:hypothetical protein
MICIWVVGWAEGIGINVSRSESGKFRGVGFRIIAIFESFRVLGEFGGILRILGFLMVLGILRNFYEFFKEVIILGKTGKIFACFLCF